ncbi:uncharacterized protein CCR75_006555 [Bremia lactucae]|uniref:PH domain-containing protein n=1 Tax=Bremia lactucae TaxID=4779 RepID=A0A976FIZ3_BRELC|nr:hypothetical protein CCR75_006555 [Bremia lactucae]
MTSPRTLRHKAVVSLKVPSHFSLAHPQQGLLIVARSKVLGGIVEIPLDNSTTSINSISEDEAHHYQLKIRYGPRYHIATLRAPTSALYETWKAALENALAPSNFYMLPAVNARIHQVSIPPVQSFHCNDTRPKQRPTLETVLAALADNDSIENIPILEDNGRSPPTESDIILSWQTCAILDDSAAPLSLTFPQSRNASLKAFCNQSNVSIVNDSINGGRFLVDNDTNDIWSRPSERESDESKHVSHIQKSKVQSLKCNIMPQPEDESFDEIDTFAFRQKVSASRKLERCSRTNITDQVYRLLASARF